MIGDTAGFVNVPALKGIHYSMKSGMLAAEAIFNGLKANSTSKDQLKSYDEAIHKSYIRKDLHKVRNMRHAFVDSGLVLGGLQAGLQTITGGNFPLFNSNFHEDADATKSSDTLAIKKIGLSKVDAVYKSGNKTRDDIPSHLIVGKDIPAHVADLYVSLCPAGVYERNGDQLIVNAPNCVDCKATDVLGPRWTPREGGSGPDYKLM